MPLAHEGNGPASFAVPGDGFVFCFCSRMEKFIRQIRYGLYGTRPMKSGTILKLPPPVWSAIYLAIAGAISAAFPWRTIIDLRFVWLGVALVVAGVAVAFSAALLFQRNDTEINPLSETNRALVVSGPYRLTRNPMYLGLVSISLGIAVWVGSLPMFAVTLLVLATANRVNIQFGEAKMRRRIGDAYH